MKEDWTCIPLHEPDSARLTGELQPIEPPEHPLAEPDATQLFDSIETAIEREREAARDSNYDQARGLSARALYERGGDAIPSLDARGESANGTYRFRVATEKNFESFDEDSLQWYVRIEFGIYEGIGVITPYPPVRTIQDRLSESIERSHAITVDTIDSFQGSEKEAIIISLVRNGDGRIGFLGREDGPRRLGNAPV